MTKGIFAREKPLLFLAFILPVLSILAGRLVAQAYMIFAVYYVLCNWRYLPNVKTLLTHPAGFLPGALIVWSGCTISWSADPAASISTMQRVGALIFAGILIIVSLLRHPLDENSIRKIAKTLLVSMGIAMLCSLSLLFKEGGLPAYLNALFSTGKPFDISMLKQGNLTFAMLTWPAAAAALVMNRRGWAFVIIALSAAIVIGMPSHTACVSLALSITCFFVLWMVPKSYKPWLTACLLAGILASIFCVSFLLVAEVAKDYPQIPPSMIHRLYIWQFAIDRIGEAPFWGWGVKASLAIPGASDSIEGIPGWAHLPLHPHNNLLQSWLEMGFPGLVLYISLISFIVYSIHKAQLGSLQIALCYALLIGAVLGGMSGFGFWQSWWVCANISVAILMIVFSSLSKES